MCLGIRNMKFGRLGNQDVFWLAKVQGTEGDCELAHDRKMPLTLLTLLSSMRRS